MAEIFDPYLQWLGIRDPERPPNHYRLLGVAPFESDPEVLVNAADRQMSHVRTFQAGSHLSQSQKLLNELAAAKICLLNVEKKAAYDAQLRAEESQHVVMAPPTLPSSGIGTAPTVETSASAPTSVSPMASVSAGWMPEQFPMPESSPSEEVYSEESTSLWFPIVALSIIAMLLLSIILAVLNAHKTREQAAEETETTEAITPAVGPSATSNSKLKTESKPKPSTASEKPKSRASVPSTPPKGSKNGALPSDKSKDAKPKKAILTTTEPEPEAPAVQPPKPPEDPRHPVPNADAQAAALKEIRELLKDRYLNAKDREQKKKLAQLLAQQAAETRDNPAARYMLYSEARDMALTIGETNLLPSIFEALGNEFRLNSRELAIETLVKAAKKPRDAVANQALGRLAFEIAKSAENQEEYAQAKLLTDVARDMARKARDASTIKQTAALLKEIEQRKMLREGLVEAEKKLATDPDDAKANYAAARYYCLVKNHWSRGLPLLMKCSDASLRAAAKAEMEHEPSSPAEMVTLADLWSDTRKTAEESGRQLARTRALYWYHRALRDVSGLTRSKIERRLAELNE